MIKSTTITSMKNGEFHQWILAVGKHFRIADNARLKHYRGRVCTITDFNCLLPTRVQIVFENGQRGAMRVVDLGDEITSDDLAPMTVG